MRIVIRFITILILTSIIVAGWVPEFNGKLDGNTCPLFSGGMKRARPIFYDLDNDGDADLLWGTNEGRLNFWENVGSAAGADWRMRSDYWGQVKSTYQICPSLGDLDDDGDVDLLLGDGYGCLRYYENIGGTPLAPEFDLVDGTYLGLDVEYNSAPFLVDIDDDGDLDLFVGDNKGNLYYYENEGTADTPNFALVDSEYITLAYTNVHPNFYDIDSDGDYDMLLHQNSVVYLYENTNNASSPVWDSIGPNYYPHTSDNCAGVATWDLDGSGKPAILFGSQVQHHHFFTNSGNVTTPTWDEASHPWQTIETSYSTRIELADLNDDGLLDMLVYGYNFQHAYKNIGSAGDPDWTLEDSLIKGVQKVYGRPTLGDIDGDGDLDMLLSTWGDSLQFFENVGSAAYPEWGPEQRRWFDITHPSGTISPTFVDIDDDGDLDLFLSTHADSVFYYENTGDASTPNFASTGVFQSELPIPLYGGRGPLYRAGMCFHDFDDDGDYDLIAGRDDAESSKLTYWENIGDNTSPTWTDEYVEDYVDTSIGQLTDVAVIDYDGDGDDDLLCASDNGGVILYIYDETVDITAQQAPNSQELSLSVYPTPFKDACRINTTSGTKKIELFDINGTLITQWENISGNEIQWQPTKNISAGLYIVKSTGNRHSELQSVIYLK